MGHGTLVDGVQRTVKNGFDLVDGVQRKVTKGLTLVGGVQRDIEFGSQMFTITMTGGSWHSMGCSVSLNGAAYYADQTIEVPKGTEIVCKAFNDTSIGADAITLDGVGVAVKTQIMGNDAWYEYAGTVTSDLTVNSYMNMVLWGIEITTG